MKNEFEVVYNGTCPVCSTEVAAYRRHAQARAVPIRFTDLTQADLARIGLDADSAARRFHVVTPQGDLLSGVPAFLILWSHLPRYRWLGRLVGLPGIRHLAIAVYDHAAAPLLYRLHLRRQARQAPPAAAPTPAKHAEATRHENA